MPQWITDILNALGAAGGFGGLAAVLVAFRGLRRHDDAVQEVRDQMQPNHGSSMRDAVDRLEKGMSRVEASQASTAARVTSLDHRLGHEMGEVRRDISDVRQDVRALSTRADQVHDELKREIEENRK